MANLGKTAVLLIRGLRSIRNSAQFGKQILYTPLTLSNHHFGNMEDTFLDCIFLGMRLAEWDNEFARTIKGTPRQLVLGGNSDRVPAAIADGAGSTWKKIRQTF